MGTSEAHLSQGAKETVLVTKRVRLVGKVPLMKINPDKLKPVEMDPVKRASIITWLHDNPSNLDSPIEKEEIIQVSKMIIQYVDDTGVPSIEDTALVSAKTLLNKASIISKQIQDIKK